MKNLAAPLVALLMMAPACGGDRDQSPGPQSPPAATTTAPDETTIATPMETTTTTPNPAPPPVPQSERIQDTMRSLVAAFNAHDARRIASLYTPDAVVAGVGNRGWTEDSGRALIEASYGKLFTAFPDVKWASPRVYVTNDAAIQEWVLTGTQQGPLGSLTATNRGAGINGASVYLFDTEGRIRREHTYYDALAMGAQLGTYKGKARALATLPAGDPQFIVAAGTPGENRWLDAARAFYSTYEQRDEKAFGLLLAKEAARTSYLLPDDRKGDRAVVEEFRVFVRAFPDLDVDTRNMWGFGDRVVTENVISTQKAGAWATARATQKPASLHTLDILRFGEDGKITELTSYGSVLELVLQSGQDQKGVQPWLPSGGEQGTTPGQQNSPGTGGQAPR